MHAAILLQLFNVHQHNACIVFIHATAERIHNRGIHLDDFRRSANCDCAENDIIAGLPQHHLVQLASVWILSLKTHNAFAYINASRIGSRLDLRLGLLNQRILKKGVIIQRLAFIGRGIRTWIGRHRVKIRRIIDRTIFMRRIRNRQ